MSHPFKGRSAAPPRNGEAPAQVGVVVDRDAPSELAKQIALARANLEKTRELLKAGTKPAAGAKTPK